MISLVGYKYERRFQRLVDDPINYKMRKDKIKTPHLLNTSAAFDFVSIF